MKTLPPILLTVIFGIVAACGSACTNFENPTIASPTNLRPTVAQSVEERYHAAQTLWQSHHLADYEITIDVFSSFLAPACHTRAVLVVRKGAIVHVAELLTPEAIQLPSGTVVPNPECTEMQRYEVTAMFDLMGKLLREQQSGYELKVEAEFNAEYGYVTYLGVAGGESVLEVRSSNFLPK